MDRPELLGKWKKFANLMEEPGKCSSLGEKLFEERYLKQGMKNMTNFDRKNDPILTRQLDNKNKRGQSSPVL